MKTGVQLTHKNLSGQKSAEGSSCLPGRQILKGTLLVVTIWVVQLMLLVLTAMIPRSAIRPSMEQAAVYYENTSDFQILWERDVPSMVHNYADAVLLNIIWNQDGEHPLDAALSGAYYESDPPQEQGKNLADAVRGEQANQEYARYWHGMAAVLKPLLCVFTVSQIKILGACVLAVLSAACAALLLWRKKRAAAFSLAVGLVMCRVWLVPMCIEYYACFALMLGASCLLLLRGKKIRQPWLLFAAVGALTCFFDFLTCEILTLGIPLIVLLLLRDEDRKESLRLAFVCCAAWLSAYALTWLCKWSLSALVLHRGIGEIALGQGIYRAAGALGGSGKYGFQPVAAMVVNLSMLQPFQALARAPAILTAFMVLALLLFSVWYLFRKQEDGPALAVFLLGLLPFVRFALISNHSALHPFMTYRDLLVTVMSVSCAMALSMGRTEKIRGRKRKK